MSPNAGRAYVTQEFSLISSLEYSHNIEEDVITGTGSQCMQQLLKVFLCEMSEDAFVSLL